MVFSLTIITNCVLVKMYSHAVAAILITLLSLLLICLVLWWRVGGSNTIKALGPVLLITAHPDDECMFFSPVLLALTRTAPQNVYLLCLSEGNFSYIYVFYVGGCGIQHHPKKFKIHVWPSEPYTWSFATHTPPQMLELFWWCHAITVVTGSIQ